MSAQNHSETVKEIIAKHFPDETPHALFTRMQSLLAFVQTIDPKLLDPKLMDNSAHKHQASQPTSSQPSMLHQYHNHKFPTANLKPEDKIRTTLLNQLNKIQAINYLTPAATTSILPSRKPRP